MTTPDNPEERGRARSLNRASLIHDALSQAAVSDLALPMTLVSNIEHIMHFTIHPNTLSQYYPAAPGRT